MEESFRSVLAKANSVVVLLPSTPTFDEVAAGLALFQSTKKSKETNISCPTPMIVEFNHLVGVNKVSQELGSKNLEIQLVNYDGEKMVEKASFDIEGDKTFLRVFPKPGFPAPTKDQIKITYSGVSADMVLLIGGKASDQFPAVVRGDFAGVQLVHIGVTEVELGDQKPLSFARPASSVCEVVASLLTDQTGKDSNLDGDIATNLIMGIEKESNGFIGDMVTADTFQTLADLLKMGGKREPDKKLTEQPRPQFGAQMPRPAAFPGAFMGDLKGASVS